MALATSQITGLKSQITQKKPERSSLLKGPCVIYERLPFAWTSQRPRSALRAASPSELPPLAAQGIRRGRRSAAFRRSAACHRSAASHPQLLETGRLVGSAHLRLAGHGFHHCILTPRAAASSRRRRSIGGLLGCASSASSRILSCAAARRSPSSLAMR